MTELKARSASELQSFRSSVLKAFGGIRDPILHELDIDSLWRITLEIDRVEVHDWDDGMGGGAGLLTTIAGSSITRIIFDRGQRIMVQKGLHEGLGGVGGGPNIGRLFESSGTFGVTRADNFAGAIFGAVDEFPNNNWTLLLNLILPSDPGDHKMVQTPRTLTATGALLEFDTASTYLRTLGFPGTESTLRGAGLRYNTSVQVAMMWFWDASENPTFPVTRAEFRHFGRIRYESL